MASIYVRCGTGIKSFVLHSASNNAYPRTISTKSWLLQSGFAAGSYDCYIDGIVYESGYSGARASTEWASSGTTGDWSIISDPYVATRSNETRYVEIYATKQATTKYRITLKAGTGISSFSFYYYNEGTYYGPMTSSSISFSADYGTNVYVSSVSPSSSYGSPYTMSDGSKSWDWSSDPYVYVSGTRTITISASVKEQTYYGRLKLNGNGGTFGSATYVYWPSVAQPASGVGGALISITLPTATQTSSIPTRTGYTFAGWAGSDSSTTVEYGYGGKVSFTAKSTYQSSPTEVTLYAVWTKTYTVSFQTAYSGVSNMPSDLTGLTSGSWVTIPSNIPALARHEFVGWATSSGGSVAYYPNGGFRISSDVTLWTVFERIQIELFFWNGNDVADANLIAKGKPVSNITAVRWNSFLAKIKELADACGVDFSYTTVSSGQDITAARFNEARTGLSKIKTALGTTTVLPAAQSRGNTVYATLFTGNGSLKGALNALIGAYNNG